MDYEKKYKNSLEKAKGFYTLCNRCGAKDTANFLEDAFPELIESENERISKKLIELIHELYRNTCYITWDEHEDILAWLKKQNNTSKEIKIVERVIDVISHPSRYVIPNKTVEEAMIDDIVELLQNDELKEVKRKKYSLLHGNKY